MEPSIITSLSTPRLVRQGALLIFGLGQRCPAAGHAGIPSQWNRFVLYIGHIEGQAGSAAYGAIYNADDSGTYDYVCGVEVREFPAEPKEFARVRIPPQSYAVFEHREHISAIAGTFRAIWEHGLTDTGYEAADGPALERYDQRFDGRTGLGGCEIWVPVIG